MTEEMRESLLSMWNRWSGGLIFTGVVANFLVLWNLNSNVIKIEANQTFINQRVTATIRRLETLEGYAYRGPRARAHERSQ